MLKSACPIKSLLYFAHAMAAQHGKNRMCWLQVGLDLTVFQFDFNYRC